MVPYQEWPSWGPLQGPHYLRTKLVCKQASQLHTTCPNNLTSRQTGKRQIQHLWSKLQYRQLNAYWLSMSCRRREWKATGGEVDLLSVVSAVLAHWSTGGWNLVHDVWGQNILNLVSSTMACSFDMNNKLPLERTCIKFFSCLCHSTLKWTKRQIRAEGV